MKGSLFANNVEGEKILATSSAQIHSEFSNPNLEVLISAADIQRKIEELGQQISVGELVSNYGAALDLLKNSQDQVSGKRLVACAQKVIGALDPSESRKAEAEAEEINWEGFSFKREVLAYEKELLTRALRETGGAVTKAARLLGFNHHQSLIALINSRHKGLVGLRAPARIRRKSIIKKDKKTSQKSVGLKS